MNIKFKTVYLPRNEGHGNARRTSLEQCNNNLVALMDADDISYSNRFEKQLEVFLNNPEIDIVGGQITEFIDEPTNITGKREVPEKDKDIKEYMKKRCPMNQVSVMLKKQFYNQVGGYIDWYCEEDYYLWIRMAEANAKFANVHDNLVNVRIGDAMSSRRGGIKYFTSELGIQKYMLKKKIISLPRFLYNVLIRFCGEVILTDKLRTIVFKKIRKVGNVVTNENNKIKEINKPLIQEFPKFSVAMCVYGGDNSKWFDVALESIINQTIKPDEIVLVVDGPIPNDIQDVIYKYEKKCGLL